MDLEKYSVQYRKAATIDGILKYDDRFDWDNSYVSSRKLAETSRYKIDARSLVRGLEDVAWQLGVSKDEIYRILITSGIYQNFLIEEMSYRKLIEWTEERL